MVCGLVGVLVGFVPDVRGCLWAPVVGLWAVLGVAAHAGECAGDASEGDVAHY